jgi:hypothetical protein
MYSQIEARQAIEALILGIWDHPQLQKLGSLHVDNELDVLRIFELTIPSFSSEEQGKILESINDHQ